MSQRRDLKIPLQMAFGRAPGDFSKPQSGTGTITQNFVNQRYIYILERVGPFLTFSRKPDFQRNFNIPLHQKVAQRKFIINGFSFAEFCVTRAKLHFGEFSNLTFQAVSWSLLFSAPAACFMMPVGRPDIVACWETRHCYLWTEDTVPC